MTFADKVLKFYKSLTIKKRLPKGVGILNPYQDDEAFNLCEQFYRKFYNDQETRRVILGINPGRFGGGITGIPFTDPVKLADICGIGNTMPKKAELSADFIYKMIEAFGGPEKFYRSYFINSVSPLGFTHEGKNLNYYDTADLSKSLEEFILESLEKIVTMGIKTDVAFCLGEGANFKYLSALNKHHKFFDDIIPLAHPRFIMQYKRKQIDAYIQDYVNKLA